MKVWREACQCVDGCEPLSMQQLRYKQILACLWVFIMGPRLEEHTSRPRLHH